MDGINNDGAILDRLDKIAIALSAKKSVKASRETEPITVRWIYVVGLIIWISILYFFKLFPCNPLSAVPLVLPFITFGINFYTAITETDGSDGTAKADILTFVFISSAIFVNWKAKKQDAKKNAKVLKIFLLALAFLMVSIIDIWLPHSTLVLELHMNTILNTISLALLVHAVMIFYTHHYW